MAGLGALVGRNAVSATKSSQPGDHSATSGRGMGDGYLLGAAYYPEWWPSSEWEIDFREMRELGINAVRMGEFAWALFEPGPGKFDFDWMDRALAIAGRNGVGAILCTPTASVPPWLYQQYPDVLSGNQLGPYTYGGRKGYNTNSANYLAACARVVTALGEHYGHHPGVIGWQLDNEPGNPFQEYDPVSEKAFQEWLKKRYGTLDELNRVWNGAFWSNMYTEWSQIHYPTNSAEGGWQPAISLDYRRFFSDSFLNHLHRQADILHAKTENQFVLTNWSSPTGAVDAFSAGAEFLDASAWDNYVSAPGLSRFQRQYTAGFLSDVTRCAGPHQRFICAEQNAYVPPNAPIEGLRMQTYCDLAHGSHGQLYFEWRRPLAGNEEHRPSFIKGFDGKINPAKPMLEQIAKEMARIGPRVANATMRSEIAIFYDYPNSWAQGAGGVGDPHPSYGEVQRFYTGLKVLEQNIDVVPVTTELASYKVVAAPNLRLIDDATVERLRQFVAQGGTLVLNYRAATQNMDNSMRLTLAPGPFAEIAGVQSEAILDLFEYNAQNGNFDANLQAGLGIRFAGSEASFSPRTAIESLTPHGAETLATVHGGGHMEGRPAVTRNRYERGWVFYVGVDCLEDEFYEIIARAVSDVSKIKPLIAAPYGVEVTSRRDRDATYYFFVNLTETAHENIQLPEPMDDLIHERNGITSVSLGPLDVAVLAAEKKANTD